MLAHQFPDVISPDTGRIMVDSTMQVVSNQGTLSNIFALGDVVQIGPNMGRAAMAQAGIVARNITALINGSRAESLYKPVLEIEAAINLTLGKVRLLFMITTRAGMKLTRNSLPAYYILLMGKGPNH